MGSDGWMWAGHSWLMGGAVVVTLLLWVVVVTAIVRMLRPRQPPRNVDAESLGGLEQRLAAGEIGIDEYRSRRRRIVDGH